MLINKTANMDLFFLVLINGLFVVGSLVPVDGNEVNYILTIVFCSLAVIYLLYFKRIDLFYYNPVLLLVLILLLMIVLFPVLHKHELYIRFFVIKLIILIFFFKTSSIDVKQYTKVINLTYVFYLFFSLLAWLGLLPSIYNTSVNSFIVNIGGYNVETLYGIEGSTANIDAYSGVIFLWNLIVSKEKHRSLIIILSLSALVLTFRGTPVIGVIGGLGVYFVVRTRLLAFISLVGVMIALIIALVLAHLYPSEQVFFLSEEKSWDMLLWQVTHARSSLWVNQLHLYFYDFTWYNYIYGPDLKDMMSYFTRPDGLELEESYNPHNSYLTILFRSTMVFIILYTGFIYYSVKTFSKKTFPLLFFISLTALTNSSIFGLGNPIYILIVLYAILGYENTQKQIYFRAQ